MSDGIRAQADSAERIWEGTYKPEVKRSTPARNLTANEIKAAMVRLYDESNVQHFSVFDEMFAPNFVSFGGAGFQDLNGAEAFRQLYVQFISALPDLNFRVEQIVVEGNLCGVRGTLSGTHKGNFMGMAPATGRFISWTGTAIFRFDEKGLSDARWQEWDGMSVMQQLGVMPAPPNAGAKRPAPTPPFVPPGVYTSPDQNRAVIRHLIEDVWNQGKLGELDAIYHPQATFPSEPQLPAGPEGAKAVIDTYRSAMPDFHVEFLNLLADGDYVLARLTQSGTQRGALMGIPPTDKKATWGKIIIARFAGGQIVESWINEDLLGLMQQLGVGGPSSGA